MRKNFLSVVALTAGLVFLFAGSSVQGTAQEPANPEAKPQTTTTKQTSPSKRRSSTKKTEPATSSTEATGDQMPASPQVTTTTPMSPTEQTDLSGTYAGTFKCEEIGLAGDTTLTITGNQFSTSDGKTGRIVASTTKGYTAVALQSGDSAAGTPTIVSLRARKSGDKLTLTSADEAHACSFTPAKTVASRRARRTQQPKQVEPVATEVASPAEAGPSPADVTGTAPKGRKSRKATTPSKAGATKPALPGATPTTMPSPTPETPATVPVPTQTPAPSPSPHPSPSTSPSPAPSPNPSPEASPSPSPEGSPSPGPSPEASPSPSPSPTPTPTPKRP